MAVAMIGPKFYAWDRNGKPLAFGKLYTYQARTNTPKPTYQSEDQQVENTNPVILNGEGYADVYLDGSYKMVLKDDKENEIWSSDPVSSAQPDEWVNCISAQYLSPTTVRVSENFTSEYGAGRKVRVNNNTSSYAYSSVVDSTFASGETTIIISDPVITTGVSEICASIVSPDSSFNVGDISGVADYAAEDVSKMISGITLNGETIQLSLGQRWNTGSISWVFIDESAPVTIDNFKKIEGRTQRDFGAQMDGVEDDKEAIEKLLSASDINASSKTTSPVLLTSQNKIVSNVSLTPDSFGGFSLDFKSTYKGATSTTSEAFTFTNSFTVSDASNIEAGNVVVIKSSKAWPFWVDCFYGMTAVVESISGNTVTLEQPFMFSVESGASVDIYEGGTLILDRIMIRNTVSAAGINSNCIRALGFSRVEIENAILENGQSKGLFIAYCCYVNVFGGVYKNSNATSTGYGIETWGCNEVSISGISGHGNRRLVDFSGDVPTIAASLRDFKIHGGGKQENGAPYSPIGGVENFGAGSHGGAVSMQISDGYVSNVSNGINIRSSKSVLKDIHFDGAIVGQIVKLTDGADVFIDGLTYRPFGSGYDQNTVNNYQTLLPNNFLLMDSAFATKGGKLKVQNCDAHIRDSFIRANDVVTGRVEMKDNNCKFDLELGGLAKWLRGEFNDVSIDGKTVENVEGTRVVVGSASSTLPSGQIRQEELYKAEVEDNDVAEIKLNTSSSQVKVEVLDRANPDVRGVVLIRQFSATLRDYGTSNLISAASGAQSPGDGVAGNLTISLQDGVLYLANKTGGALVMSLSVQYCE